MADDIVERRSRQASWRASTRSCRFGVRAAAAGHCPTADSPEWVGIGWGRHGFRAAGRERGGFGGMAGLGSDTNFIIVPGAAYINRHLSNKLHCQFDTVDWLHPVLHGDAVLDELLTDVYGVYDRPPTDPNAVLLREIEVDDNGSWSIVKPASLQGNKNGVEISVAAHDTTGGMETKILEAAMIARLGIDVYITKPKSPSRKRLPPFPVSFTGSQDGHEWFSSCFARVGRSIDQSFTPIETEEIISNVKLKEFIKILKLRTKALKPFACTSRLAESYMTAKTMLWQLVYVMKLPNFEGYRGVICGMDPVCCESKSWMETANVEKLSKGPNQPFYQVLVDVHVDPELLVAYGKGLIIPTLNFFFMVRTQPAETSSLSSKLLGRKYDQPRYVEATGDENEDDSNS
ncbi:hypothetical protein PR202_ga09556 [Eleusine coracana subsp. coracana]|uniref:Hemimethylated DNA-binding domain-containing protein n=1 Tax=Eleusine coracana subsp. coracana TaxID=191504 RepID=A0AAV5C550_ELECO|nr:hypothetical protein PR202_ga09556 [Eleusine coracana subsp. coracana]